MRIVTYNINGIRASHKLGLVDWIDEYDADVYCFQEVRANKSQTKELLYNENTQIDLFSSSEPTKLMKYHAIYNCGNVPGYAGTMILSRIKPDKVLYDMGEYWTDDEGRTTTIIIDNIAIIDAYIPNGNSRLEFKMQYLDALTKYISYLKESYSVICVGDYNIAHNEIDLTHPRECRNKSVFLPIEREAFTKIIDTGMVDGYRYKNPSTVKYSWRSYRSRMDTSYRSWQYRIDYIVVSSDVKDNIDMCDILDLPYSDHLPVVMELNI